MKIYFANTQIENSKTLGEKLINENIDIILSSPLNREKDISSIISSIINVPYKTTDILSERNRLSFIVGKLQGSSFGLNYSQNLNIKQIDEEYFKNLKLRSKLALSLFDNLNLKGIMIVASHSFQSFLLANMLFGENLTKYQYLSLNKFLKTSELQVIVSKKCDKYWKLLSLGTNSD